MRQSLYLRKQEKFFVRPLEMKALCHKIVFKKIPSLLGLHNLAFVLGEDIFMHRYYIQC